MSRKKKQKEKKVSMKNITIYLPDVYIEKIAWLKRKKRIPSQSEAVRTALREFLQKEYGSNLRVLGFKR